MTDLLRATPREFTAHLRNLGGRAYVVRPPNAESGRLEVSHPELEPLAEFMAKDARDYLEHEASFFAVGPQSGALFGAFVHKTPRGQGAGGLRYWPYDELEGFIRDGLRLSAGMTRKNALAGLWWGGGKGIIVRDPAQPWRDPDHRAEVYREYGAFVSSLRGLYVTAEDAGTRPEDMRAVFSSTRHVTCIPPEFGGSGNPSRATALGVVSAMEAALDATGRGGLEGKTVAMQGAGNVAGHMIDRLLELGASVVASDIDAARVEELRVRHTQDRVKLRVTEPGDTSIFAEPCDIFAPNALGGALNPETIPKLRAAIVCGAANNQLLDDARDMAALDARGIVYVPDFLCNRMGIVNCANEQYGSVPADPAFERHLGREWENSIFVITKSVLTRARSQGTSTAAAAIELADELARVPHPIWGHRGADILDGLLRDDWAGARARRER